MAIRTDTQDQQQPQPDPNPNTNPNIAMPQQVAESPKPLETLQPQDRCDDQEDPTEEETNVEDPDFPVSSSPPSSDFHVTSTTTAIAGSCRGGGPKRKKTATKRRAQEKKSQKKLEILTEILRPIPFVPSKTLDFSSHEKLLKRLGLWEFVHLEFDGNVRVDLISQLIATYNSQSRCSYVSGCRIGVNRADLARALKLSVKKDKDKDKDSIGEVEGSKESIGFVEDFVSNWVLLHEDTWVMPVEVLNWIKMIKEGHFEKIDWPGLIWFMVEKELMAAPNLGNCYYASHMQCLIKFQREELLQEIPKVDVYDTKGEEEEHNISGDSKMVGAQEKKSPKKPEILAEILRPIPFVPSKTLDFSSHEKLLKRLGLWDFVHLEFDGSIRVDLISQLIDTYNSQSRCSYVNGCRIGVNRADLARALKLSVKKDKDKDKDSIGEEEDSKESIGFVEDFVSNWVLLHEDTWVMPVEVLNWIKMIKEGHFEKIDWPGLIWFMVEKELMAAPNLGNCYYASHMQCLIKFQREELLQEIPKMDVYDTKGEEEEHNISRDSKMAADGIEEFHGGSQLEEHNIELSLGGQDNLMNKDDVEKEAVGDEDVMDCEESKGDEDQRGKWHLDGDSYMDVGGENLLRRCNLGDIGCVDMEEEKKQEKGGEREEGETEVGGEMEEREEGGEEEEQDEQHEEGFPISPKGDNLEGVHSTNLLEAMETADLPFTTGLHIRDSTSGQFLVSRGDAQTVAGVSSFLSNGNKREIDHENDLSRHSLNGSNKRLRTDGQWVDKPSDFDMCLEQMQHWIDKARMLYAAKEQAYGDSSMHQQVLLDELQRRDSIIEHLHKAKYEEQHKRQMEVYRLERELYLMENLLDGYRKALKETSQAFAEYRARCPLPDEPLYKDVSGSGGLVLSTMELEKQRLKQEEEERINRLLIEKRIKDFEVGWIGKFDAHKDAVSLLSNRLIDAEKDVKHLKDDFANHKASDTHECLPNEL